MSEMFEAMERGELRSLYVLGENPLQSEADQAQTRHRLESLDFLIVQDIFLTATAEMADVVFPAAAGWCESDGTVTNSERRVQRVRKALDPPAGARDDSDHPLRSRAPDGTRLGRAGRRDDLGRGARAQPAVHAGMSYARLEADHGLQWPCYDEDHPGELFLHSRLWERPLNGPRVAFHPVEHDPPVERLTRRVSAPAHDGPPARRVQYGRPDLGLRLAAAAGREPRHLAGGRGPAGGPRTARSFASRRGAGESRCRCGSTRACVRGSRS